MTTYASEQDLVDKFLICLQQDDAPWVSQGVYKEFFYQRGRADIVALTEDGEVIAVEAKLTRWRDALQQAYRNTCFAHRSYVLLPTHAAKIAERHRNAFERRGVGLCSVADGKLSILYPAPRAKPLQSWLCDEAAGLAFHLSTIATTQS
jgi:hypothetical protein